MRSVMTAGLLAATLVVSSGSFAQEDPRRVQAEQLMKEGTKLRETYDAESALTKFREAYAVYPTPNALFAVASTEHFLGKNLEAIRHYREALRSPTLHPTNAQRGKEYVQQLEAKLGRLDVKAPARSAIAVDGVRYAGPANEPIDVQPGDHAVEASVDDQKKSVTVHCDAGQIVAATIVFDATTKGAAPQPEQPKSSSVFTTPNVVGGSLAILGVAATAIGTAFLLDSNGKADDAKTFNDGFGSGGACATRTAECESYRGQLDDARSSRTASYVGYAVGGALIAGAIVVFAFWRSPKDAPAAARLGRGLRFEF